VSEASLYRWRDEFLAAGEAALAGGTRNGASTRDRQIVEFEQQIEKRDQVIGELTVANRILKNSRDSPSECRDTFCDHSGARRDANFAEATSCSGAKTDGCRSEQLVPAVIG
jgi:hypothetical protein